MKSSTKKAVWVGGLVLGAVGLGTGIFLITKPKQTAQTPPPKTPTPPPGGGTAPTPTFVTPTATPGIFAAFAPNANVSWVDQNGKPIGQGGGGGIDTSTSRIPR